VVRLESIEGENLSRFLREVSPMKYQSNKQVNKLLDGTYHVQIIGEPMKTIDAVVIASFNQAERLNFQIDQGSPLVLFLYNKKYLVYINEAIDWKKLNYGNGDPSKSFCEGKFSMIVKEEVEL
jgi:hypothetical protein